VSEFFNAFNHRVTPAIQAGIANHVWSIEEIMALADSAEARRVASAPLAACENKAMSPVPGTILVIDDAPLVLSITRAMLTRHGYTVITTAVLVEGCDSHFFPVDR